MALTQWSHGSAIDPLLNHEEPVWALFLLMYALPISEGLGETNLSKSGLLLSLLRRQPAEFPLSLMPA
jgi:hypothetical protein